MAMIREREPHSYRSDPACAGFDDTTPVCVMDAECALCSAGARLIARMDRREEIRILPGQSAMGTALLAHYGMRPDDPESWLYLEDGRASGGLEAMIRLGARTGGLGLMLLPLGVLPKSLQRWIYRRIALNRYRLFGRGDMCAIPDKKLQARLMR